MKKAHVVYDEVKLRDTASTANDEEFKVSSRRLENFMRRYHPSLRRKMSAVQKDPNHLVAKVVSYVLKVRRMQAQQRYSPCNISAMHETLVWGDMVSKTTVDTTGKKTITLKTTGHEKSRVPVCLAAKANGTKLRQIVFKGAKLEMAALHLQFKSQAYIASSSNA